MTNPNWSLIISYPATDFIDAEDKAAAILDHVMIGRSSLYYPDPITGDMKLWCEPALDTDELEVHRDRS